jgi:ribokinase
MDLVLTVERLPCAGETIPGGDLALFPGGKGANQACAAARLGGKVSFIAQVGTDAFAEKLVDSLREAGVDTAAVGRTEGATGCACVYVMPDGQNSIVVSSGANTTLTPEVALSRLRLKAGDLVLCQLESPLETVQAVFAQARDAGAVTLLDPAPARALPPQILALVDVLTPNQIEAEILLGGKCKINSRKQAEHAGRTLRQLGPRVVILKLGELGCFVSASQAEYLIAAHRVAAVDATAAGDVFNGALAVGLSEGRPLSQAAQFANAAAAISVTRRGAQASMPSREETDRLMTTGLLASQ